MIPFEIQWIDLIILTHINYHFQSKQMYMCTIVDNDRSSFLMIWVDHNWLGLIIKAHGDCNFFNVVIWWVYCEEYYWKCLL